MDNLNDLIFSGDYAIVTWSVYSKSLMFNSKLQTLHMLRIAGVIGVKNVIYLDMSGMFAKAFADAFQHDDVKGLYHILTAIQTNYIITLNNDKFERLTIDLGNDKIFKREPVELTALL